MAELKITKGDHEKHLVVQSGDTISLDLEENPTTGFQWEVDGLDSELMELSGSSFNLNSPDAIGGGGIHTYQFMPKKPGRTRISLKRWRPWEGESSVKERFEIFFRID
jgi:inhibitor of cysteine peptidase